MCIKFQDKLLKDIDSFTLETLPHSILLQGNKGSGRHSICDYISKKYGFSVISVTKKLDDDMVAAIYMNSLGALYIVDIDLISYKDQNTLLKLLEEPPKNSYFILIYEEDSSILPTILNRCFQLKIAPYSKENLESFISRDDVNKELVLSISNTPGDVIYMQDQDLDGMKELSLKMIQKMNIASFPNALSISDKIAYKNEKGKYDLSTFLRIFRYCLLEDSLKEYSKLKAIYLNELVELNKQLKYNINQKYAFEHFITNLWRMAQSEYGY